MDAARRLRPPLRLGERVSLRLSEPAGDLIGFVTGLDPLTLEDRHGRLREVPDGSVVAARRVGVALGRDPRRASRTLLDELALRAGLDGEPQLWRISDLVAGSAPPAEVFAERGQWRSGRWLARVEGEWLTTNVTERTLLVALAWWAGRQNARSVQVRGEPAVGSTGGGAGLVPHPGEPLAGPWRSVPVDELAAVVGRLGEASRSRRVVAVDGRSGSGKSTLALALSAALGSVRVGVVGTDDLAWHHSRFDWAAMARTEVIEPFRRGEPVDFRPPAWRQRGRTGSIVVAPETRVLLLEGVGASQRALTPDLEGAIWVQSDAATAERLGIARDIASGVNGDEQASIAFWRRWMTEEVPFLASDRPWERADLIVAGTCTLPVPDGCRLVAAPQHAPGST